MLGNNITINSHSSIRIQGSDRVIYFDPFNIETNVNDADWVFITHDHYDHFSVEDMKKVIKPGTIFIAPNTMRDQMLDLGIPDGQMDVMLPDEKIDLEGLHIEAVPAYNKLKPFHAKMARWLGYVVDVDGERIYVAGDTDITDEALAVECDVALVPCGGTYTMDTADAAKLVNAIKPKVAIPTHYGSIVGKKGDGKAFSKLVDKDIKVEIKIK